MSHQQQGRYCIFYVIGHIVVFFILSLYV